MDALMQSLLQEPSYAGTPTSRAYLDGLAEASLREEEFVQVTLRVDGVERELLPTWGDFGGRVQHRREERKGGEGEEAQAEEVKADRGQLHLEVDLVAADPLDGKGLRNAAELKGRAALLERGRISFVDKSRAVQQSGAALALVQQSDDTWPYVMTDQAKTGKDIVCRQRISARRRHRCCEGTGSNAAPLSLPLCPDHPLPAGESARRRADQGRARQAQKEAAAGAGERSQASDRPPPTPHSRSADDLHCGC